MAIIERVSWCRWCFRTHDESKHGECQEAAREVYASEDFWTPEYVEAWRGFRIAVDHHSRWSGHFGQLRDPLLMGMRTAWSDADPGPAECVSRGQMNPGLGWEHKSPHVLCTCGYHALKTREMVRNDLPIHAKVEMWGDIIEHEDGYRAERIKLVGLEYSHHYRNGFLFQRRERVHRTLQRLREKYKVGGIE